MKRTIQKPREVRGEARSDFADALGVTLDEVTDWVLGRVQPRIARMRTLTEQFDVRDDQTNLQPRRSPSIADRLGDLL
jgi:transcriptional regulator with XRE-family HTH domain